MEVGKIVKELARRKDDEVVVFGELGIGYGKYKLEKGTKARDVKLVLYYLLLDLGYELDIDFDKEKLRKEIWG